ncbi:MAG: hypothetical protein HYU81_01060 [Candidatus Brennerbacteria bacterium]|nr:hypothetical protein [Candidatus Brennerbacteria bacterium]
MNGARHRRMNHREGSSLAESMVALGLVVVGLLGVVALFTRSFALNRGVMNRTIAAGLAAEGIEVVKNIIDTNVAERGSGQWTEFLTEGSFTVDYGSVAGAVLFPASGARLRLNEGSGLYALAGGGAETIFKRRVTIAFPSEREVRVGATVEWDERGEVELIDVEDHFFNWRR